MRALTQKTNRILAFSFIYHKIEENKTCVNIVLQKKRKPALADYCFAEAEENKLVHSIILQKQRKLVIGIGLP